MKVKLLSKEQMISKRLLIPALVVVIAAGTLLGTTLINSKPAGATDSPLVDQVQQQQDELNNHESRISNAENNITGLQAGSTTSTPPTDSTTTTTITNQAAPSTAGTATVTGFLQIPLDNSGNVDCKLTYSDGTTYQWHWQVPSKAWMTDGQGQNGHWTDSYQNTGQCDNSIIGSMKVAN